MAISPELQQFKSSGVYRLEFDKSQTVNVPQETIRLVVGHSETGPYNTPVFIENTEQFIQAFGSATKSMESRGMYFHRSAIEALSRGPILAVNLFKSTLDGNGDEVDQASWVSVATNGSQQGLASDTSTAGFSKYFDTERFWNPTDDKLLRVVEQAYTADTANYPDADAVSKAMQDRTLNFVNIKQDPITVIVKQAADTRGFEITAREWYGEGNQPEGVDPLDYISEYMVDVLVFKGKFDAAELNNDPVYGTYFDEDGLVKEKLGAFANLREVSLIASYTGSLIPDFIDLEGRQLYIEALINLETRRTGLFCAVNEAATESVDLVGDSFDVYQDYEVLSHIVKQDAALDQTGAIDVTEVSVNTGLIEKVASNELRVYGENLTGNILEGDFLGSSVSGEYARVESCTWDSDDFITTIITSGEDVVDASNSSGTTPFSFQSATGAQILTTGVANDTVRFNGTVNPNGASIAAGNFIKFNNSFYKVVNTNINGADIDIQLSESMTPSVQSYLVDLDFSVYVYFDVNVTSPAIVGVYNIGLNSRVIVVPDENAWEYESTGAGVIVFDSLQAPGDPEPVFNTDIKVGQYFSMPNNNKLSRILQIVKSTEDEGSAGIRHKVTFVTHREITARPNYAFKSYDEVTVSYKTFPLEGCSIPKKNIKDLLDILVPGEDKGFANTLVDKDAITYRYLVDTFGSLENNEIFNKVEFTKLARERQNASAILNAPMVTELRKCTNPSFVDSNDVFKAKYISTGGNLDSNPSRLYKMPEVLEGANYGFYYGPGLVVVENGKRKIIPPAAYVSNNFIDKYSNALPWSIVAGPRRGVVTGKDVQGVEYSFDKLDRDVVEPFGINPIVFERGVGLVVKGNKTAQQKITSALSSAHVREVLIYIEDGLAEILQNYLFEFNTAQTRLEIKTLADAFMDAVQKDGGVYDYRNIMDTTNNTNEVIDANMGVLDTYVEPVKGLEILVSRVTVLNTGEIAAGNFS
jgi:hypothetical protein